jgi:DNA-binding CsgD family transcriptional regulator
MVLFSLLFFAGCSLTQGYETAPESWEYRKGFDSAWLSGSDPEGWRVLKDFGCGQDGGSEFEAPVMTMRYRIPDGYARSQAEGTPFSLYLKGFLGERVEIYLNNRKIGLLEDRFTPRIDWQRTLIASLPTGFPGETPPVLYLVFHTRTGRSIDITEAPVIAETVLINRNYYGAVVVAFMIIAFYLLAGLYHLLLGIRSPGDRYNIYFGIFALVLAVFQTTNAPGKELIWQNHIILMAALDRITLKIATAFLVLFFSSLFRKRITVPALLISLFSGILVIQDFLILFGNWRFFMIRVWYPAGISGVAYIVWILLSEVRKKNLNAMILSAGSLCVAAGVIHDILLTERIISGNLISQYLILILFCGTALMLISSFIDARRSVEDMNKNLESRVLRKTDELLAANEKIAAITRRKLFMESFDLTYREREILQLILDGHSTSGMAEEACISPRTVEKHIQHIYEKISVHSRMEILVLYNQF